MAVASAAEQTASPASAVTTVLTWRFEVDTVREERRDFMSEVSFLVLVTRDTPDALMHSIVIWLYAFFFF